MNVVFELLLTTPGGLLSLFTILFAIGIGFFMAGWVTRRMIAPWK